MVQYNLTFDLLGSFGSAVPKLAIYYAGIKVGMAYASANGNSVDVVLDSDREFTYDQLRFKFIDDKAEANRSISISNIQLGSMPIDVSLFSSKNAIVKTASSIVLKTGQHADVALIPVIPEIDLIHFATETADTSALQSLASPEPVSISSMPEVFAVFAPPPPSFFATITGTALDNKLYGTTGDDNISGLDGNDKILAYAGNDLVYGGNGNDYIDGGDGNDTLYGDAGNDKIYGGLGNDTIYGGANDDALYGGGGTDFIYGDDGNDLIKGEAGDDTLYGGLGNDKISGDAGNDVLWGGDGDDELFGDEGDDELHGGIGNDRMIGNDGNDTMYGDDGNDNMDGQYGNDTMYGGDGADNIDGEQGDDYLDGGNGDDFIYGGSGSDTLLGGAGNDIMHAGGIASWDQLVIRQNSTWGATGVGAVWFNEQTQSFYRYVTTTANYATAFAAAQASLLNGVAGHLVNITSVYEANWIRTFITSDTWMGITDEDVEGAWGFKYGAEAGSTASNGAVGVSGFYANWASGEPNNSGGNENHAEFYTSGLFNDEGDSRTNRYLIEWNAEEISPDSSANTLYGGDGNDQMYGDAGIDTMYGGNDDDIMFGLGGNDIMSGDAGNDSLNGGSGNDTMDGGDGNDYLHGGAGNDSMLGGNGNDRLYGDDGDDILDGGANDDIMVGGSGTDTASYGSAIAGVTVSLALTTAQNTVGWGTDTLSGFENLVGSGFNDILTGDANANAIYGGNGNDTIDGGLGNDLLYGEAGIDTVTYISATAGVNVSLALATAQNTVGAGIDTLSGFENLTGSNFNDTLEGNSGNNTIDGGTGTDTITYANAGSAVTVSLALATAQNTGGAGTDTLLNLENLTGSNFNDMLTGSTGANTIDGGNGNDTIDGGLGNDTLIGGAGTDTLLYASATSAVTVSLALATAQNTGGAGTDTVSGFENLTGSSFNDNLTGDANANVIDGAAGNDTITAGAGNDTVYGGLGADTIYGGLGSDILNGDDGDDIIYAYDATSNRNHVGATLNTTYVTYVNANFGANSNPFTYADINDPANVDVIGTRITTDGNTANGSLEVYVDGQNNSAFTNASGEWSTTVNITSNATNFLIQFSYRHYHDTNNDNGENSEAYFDVNGTRTLLSTALGSAGTTDTGWVTYTVDLGPVTSGQSYTIDLGLIHYGSNRSNEDAYARFDDVLIRTQNGFFTPGVSTPDADDANVNILSGGNGNDTLYGSSGNDELYGGAGADTLYSGTVDTLSSQINAILAANPNISYSTATGNFYQIVSNTINWTDANVAAQAATINGVAGHLATVTSAAEHAFLKSLVGGLSTWLGGTDTSTEGVWRWVTGPENGRQFANSTGGAVNGNYSVWEAGQPNDTDGTQDYLYMLDGDDFADLVNIANGSTGFVTIPQYAIEWEASALLNMSKTNILDGGAGADTLYGSDGIDIFNFSDISSMDTIINFNTIGRDAIDISDVLTGFNYLTSNLDEFVRLTTSGGNTILQVDTNGAVGGASWTNVVQINGVTGLDVDAMVTHGNLLLS